MEGGQLDIGNVLRIVATIKTTRLAKVIKALLFFVA